MTVMYCDKVASRGGFGSFFKLLLKWRGSVYKMVWQDMVAFTVMYYIISFIYRFGLDGEHKTNFEYLVIHCAKFRNLIPISFVLGFFVSLVVGRWWNTYQSVPWPDTLAMLLATYVPGQDENSRNLRTTILRYVNFTIAVTFATISPAVKNNFPNLQHYVAENYITEEERAALVNLDKRCSTQHKTWIPITWALKTLHKARSEGLLASDSHQRMIAMEISSLRGNCGGLLGFYYYNIPLVYTQVVTIAVYSFFVFSLIGEQFIDPDSGYSGHTIDLYVPLFSLLQMFFYIGWIKVAEALLNPFGNDDHDFEFNCMLTRHKEMSALLSEASNSELPPHLRYQEVGFAQVEQ